MTDNPDPLLYTLFVAKAGDLMDKATYRDKYGSTWETLREIKHEIFGRSYDNSLHGDFITKCLRIYHEQHSSPRPTAEE